MRKRNVHIQFWLDKKEAEAFQKKVKKSGLPRETYLRHLVNGLEPQDAPPPVCGATVIRRMLQPTLTKKITCTIILCVRP